MIVLPDLVLVPSRLQVWSGDDGLLGYCPTPPVLPRPDTLEDAGT